VPRKAPRPDRAPLDAACKALDDADAQFEHARRQWAERQAELERERRSLEQAHEKKIASLQRELDRVEAAYDRAITKWRG
jgi:sRNA-binding protein